MADKQIPDYRRLRARDKQITGAYVRVMRDGRALNLEINELTDRELDRYFESQPPLVVQRWARFLAGWIRDNVKNE